MPHTQIAEPAVFIGVELAPAFGEWVKLEGKDMEDLLEIAEKVVKRYNRQYPGEFASDWCVSDSEGFQGIISGEVTLSEALMVAELLAEHEHEAEAIAAYVDSRGARYTLYDGSRLLDAEEVYENFQDCHMGTVDEAADYFYDVLQDSGAEKALEQFGLQHYLYDLAKLQARDAEYSGEIDVVSLPSGQKALFNQRA